MTADEFIKIVRGEGDKLRIDEVIIHTGTAELRGKGTLRISRERFEAEVTIQQGQVLPDLPNGIYTKKDAWNVSGLIEDQLQFRCSHVAPAFSSSMHWPGAITRCKLALSPLELAPVDTDAMTREERRRFMHAMQSNASGAGEERPSPPEVEAVKRQDACFYATLLEYPWLSSKQGLDFKGETGTFDFILSKQKNEDVHVSLESKPAYISTAAERDWSKFHAFMNGLGLVTGTHAWPYQVAYWRAGQKQAERIMPASKLGKTSHAPFDERLAFAAITGRMQWDFADALRKAATFFEQDTALSREISQILFLFRQADANVQSQITTIALCVLFENLVQLIFKHLELEKTMSAKVDSFMMAKEDVAAYIRSRTPETGAKIDEGYTRLLAITKTAQPFVMKQLFVAVVTHLGLSWHGDMEEVWRTWSRTRNTLVHAHRRAADSDEDFKNAVTTESRVAGAINILVLKLLGYSGLMRPSAFEDNYRRI